MLALITSDKSEFDMFDDCTKCVPLWKGKTIVSEQDKVPMPLEAVREVSPQFLRPSFTTVFHKFPKHLL